MKKKVYCIGDSHSSFFSGYDEILPLSPDTKNRYPIFEAYRLGAPLAYNMSLVGTTSRGKELFFELLSLKIPEKATIMLVFGEIDCRVHIVKQAKIRNISIKEGVKETVSRYWQFVNEVKSKGYKVIIWNVVPTSRCQSLNNEYPHNGTLDERTQATLLFNDLLKEFCKNEEIRFVSIYDFLVDKEGKMGRKYFKDCVHLSQNAIKFIFSELNLPLYYYIMYYYYSIVDSIKPISNKIANLLFK